MNSLHGMPHEDSFDFASPTKEVSFLGEWALFVRSTGKWWLLPVLLSLLLLGLAAFLSTTYAAPFIYTLF